MPLTFPEPTTQLHRVASALDARLKAIFPAPFSVGLMPPAPSKTEFERLTQRKPFIGYAFSNLRARSSGRLFAATADWMVLLAVDNADASRRHLGDERGIGLFGMITAAVYGLNGWTIDGIGTMTVSAADVIVREDWANETTAIAVVGLAIDHLADQGIAGAISGPLDDLLSLTCTWTMAGADGPVSVATDTLSTGS